MTSIPASRKARAMIFAPRSCPSRPGLAMTTLILRATARSLVPAHPHERELPRRSLLDEPRLRAHVVRPPAGGGGQRDAAGARARQRRDPDVKGPGRDPERQRGDLVRLLGAMDPGQ